MSIVGICRRTAPFIVAAIAIACSHEDAPAVDDPFIVPVPPGRKQPLAAERDAGACSPHDVSDFKPTFVKPLAIHQNVCTAAQIDVIAGCMDTGQRKDQSRVWMLFANASKGC